MEKTSPLISGTSSLDEIMEGGLREGELLHIYGPSGVGKTTLALQYVVNAARKGGRIYYVNAEGMFPIIRLQQLASKDFEKIAPLVSVITPSSFEEQADLVSNLETIITSEGRLLVFDTIVSLYRKELNRINDNILLNRQLNQQMGKIASLVKSRQIITILINQVRSDLVSQEEFKPVADSVISFWCTSTIKITKAELTSYREFKVKKRDTPEQEILFLKLKNSGFR